MNSQGIAPINHITVSLISCQQMQQLEKSEIDIICLRLPGTYGAKINENQTPLAYFPQ